MIQIKVKDELILFTVNDAFDTLDMPLRFFLDLFPGFGLSKNWTLYKSIMDDKGITIVVEEQL